MSHFTVLVIGDDVEAQLAPYHEYECTGINDEFVQDVDKTAELRAQYEEHDFEGAEKASFTTWLIEYEGYEADHFVAFGAEPDTQGRHKWGYVQLDENGDAARIVRRTNPNAKWDWYQIGGRWSGFFKLKPDAIGHLGDRSALDRSPDERAGYADCVRKAAVDFEAMRDEDGNEAGEAWDQVHAVTGDLTWEPWTQVLERFGEGRVQEARDFYHNQEAVKRVRADKELGFIWDLDRFLTPRDQFVQQARDNAFSTYAVVKDGQWIGKGEMGWWGMSNDAMTQDEWNARFNEMLDGLPDDTLLTVVDCHI